jgi:hypothetical protein
LTDAYNRGNDSGQVLLPGRQSLVYPTGSFRADALDVEHPIYFGAEGGMNGLRAIDMIRAAPLVTVSIDVIIFEDGRIIGPDDSQTVNRITERKRAAEDFVALVNRAIDEGLNVEEVLNGICTTTPQNSRDFYNSSLHRFARTLTRRPGIDPRLAVAQFANLPPLPKFWRAGENPEFT